MDHRGFPQTLLISAAAESADVNYQF